MNLKSIATLAASLVAAASVSAHDAPDMGCGADACGKKTTPAKKTGKAKKAVVPTKKEASCSKKDASCAKK